VPDPRPTIVKLGGSVITRKREIERVRPKVLQRLGVELGRLSLPGGLIVLHGAGSFGHPGARRFGLARPPEPGTRPETRRRGGAIVAREVRRLHGEVLRSLIDGGAPAFSAPPNVLARNREGRLASFAEETFRRALSEGWVPVSFGDVVPDDAWGLSILSADTLALELGRRLGARRVVFVSDVPGILPAVVSGRPIPIARWTGEDQARLTPVPGAPDVTGGIRAKGRVMLDLAAAGVPAGIVSGLHPGAAGLAVGGDDLPFGTWALPSGPSERRNP
jgi:isopentenyl phosphate kinase